MPSLARKRRASDVNEPNTQPTDEDFKKGAIYRIKLTNFMTYSSVSLEAGPYLNLIIGPNGTGKSAIVCGLIIGLAGDISNTGRSGDLAEYIKFGCDTATIEIELCNPGEPNYVITRKLQKGIGHDGKPVCNSTWMKDGKRVLKREIKDLVTSLNISVDNLCQCLPQERVVEFVKMNSKELLKKTQEAIGESALIARHEQLCQTSKNIKELNAKFKQLSGQTREDEQVQKRCEEEVKRLKERKKLKEQLNLMEAKRGWLEYMEVKRKFDKAKQAHAKKVKLMENLEASFAPSTNAQKQFQKEMKDIDNNLVSFKKEKQTIVKNIKASSEAIKKLVNEERSFVVEYKNALDEDKRRVQMLKDMTREIVQLESELSTHEALDVLTEHRDEVRKELVSLQNSINDFEYKIDNEERLKDQAFRKLRTEKYRLEQDSALGKRKNLLATKNDHAFRALQLLEENRGRFQKEIHPPMLLSIDVKDESYVRFVEACFPSRDLMAFVCEDKEDLKNFGALVRSNGLKIAIVMAPEDVISIPSGISPQLASFGFTHTIADLFDAPPAIKSYLEQQYQISRIPVQAVEPEGESKIEEKIHAIRRLNIYRFFSHNTSFRISTSQYDGEVVITRDSINNPSLLYILNENDHRTQSNIELLKKELEQHVSKINQLSESKSELDVQKKDFMRKDTVIKGQIESVKTLTGRIALKKRELQKKKDVVFDANAAREELCQKIQRKRTEFNKLIDKMAGSSNKLVENTTAILRFMADRKTAESKHAAVATLISKFEEERTRYKKDLRNIETTIGHIKEEAVRARHKAALLSKSKGVALDENNMLTSQSKAQFAKITSDLDKLNAEIGALAMKEQSLSGLVNDQAEADAERRLAAINNNKQILEEYAGKLRQMQDILTTSKEDWIDPLKELIERINVNFAKFMRHMGYAGQVQLAEKGDVFEEYGISIQVKYRSTDAMADLSAFHQSGGERSVATVIYMLALQELSKVPFRCVDEINQGMDTANERKVFDLVVDTAIDNSSQYFLLSPKLLLDLQYNSKMHIHCIHNGPKLEADWVAAL